MSQHDEQLLWQLRGLRRDQLPDNDLWPGIAARIAQADQATAAPRRAQAPRGLSRFAPWALAASLVLVVGVTWQQRPDAGQTPAMPSSPLIHREAEAMTREYTAALREMQASRGPAAGDDAALQQLDQGAAQIRTALSQDPEARFLLDRLRSTYEKRLKLTRQAPLT